MDNSKGQSFSTFQRNVATTSSNSTTYSNTSETCRRKLNYKNKENSTTDSDNCKSTERSVLSIISLNDTRRVLRNGAERISKTFNSVKTSIGSFSQMFKISTKRRQILEEGPMTPDCSTPHTMAKQVLGRTPTKLYSPFNIESPYQPTTYDKENIPAQQRQVNFFKWITTKN